MSSERSTQGLQQIQQTLKLGMSLKYIENPNNFMDEEFLLSVNNLYDTDGSKETS